MDATHAYCPNCKRIQPVKSEPLTNPDDSGKYLGGDIVCAVCAYIIATLYRSSAPGSR
jgi:hypothetical protein